MYYPEAVDLRIHMYTHAQPYHLIVITSGVSRFRRRIKVQRFVNLLGSESSSLSNPYNNPYHKQQPPVRFCKYLCLIILSLNKFQIDCHNIIVLSKVPQFHPLSQTLILCGIQINDFITNIY